MLRLTALPPQLHILVQYRLASTAPSSSSNIGGTFHQFPFPTHPEPTPHQIFHLSYGASQRDIKTRYFDLVRIYHPDSLHCRTLPPEERHSRFHAIAAAYDALRGKGRFQGGRTYHNPSDNLFEAELTRRRNAFWAHPSRRPGYADHFTRQQQEKDMWSSNREDYLKDCIIIIFGVLSFVVGVVPGFIVLPGHLDRKHKQAAANLKQARSDAREFGDARMAGIRRRVQEIKSQGT
ncbi:hypothetical protein AX15_004158 [Amanita polypyramis BW_CC]|nr:hypothetical protein AX15_004158 [Amanita polypyramis BW_CC]